jgi:exodeoxyribonuclease V gamma subunit
VPVRSAWLALGARYPDSAPKLAVGLEFDGVELDDWIDRLRTGGGQTVWLLQVSSKVLDRHGEARGDKLIVAWLRQLAAAAAGAWVSGYLVARDAIVEMAPIDRALAHTTLARLVALWRRNLDSPLPVACKSALAQLQDGKARMVYEGGFEIAGEVSDLCLARLWPDFAALTAGGDWPALASEVYGPLVDWLAESVAVTRLQGETA